MVICIFLLGMIITECSQPYKPTLNNEPNNVRGSTEEDINWQALAADYNPSSIGGLLNVIKNSNINADGNVVINPEIKREFNQMGEDYPKLCHYESGMALRECENVIRQ